MNMERLKELHRTGIRVFVEHHHVWFKPKKEAIEELVRCNVSNENGANIRVGYAKIIINDIKAHKECLNYIIYQANVSADIKTKAREILALL